MLKPEVIEALKTVTLLDGEDIFGIVMPTKLDRKTYVETDKVLRILGGKWNKSVKAHVFAENPWDDITDVVMTRDVVDVHRELQFFPTPEKLARKLVALADIQPNHFVLEPSAGDGALVSVIADANPHLLAAVEIDPRHESRLKRWTSYVYIADFLSLDMVKVDRVVMNPPFNKGREIDHVMKALTLLEPGGKLVAIMSPGFTFRQDRKYRVFREMIEEMGGRYEHIESGEFKQSGTYVATVMLEINMP